MADSKATDLPLDLLLFVEARLSAPLVPVRLGALFPLGRGFPLRPERAGAVTRSCAAYQTRHAETQSHSDLHR
jgi:hypothetical protein